LLAALDKDPAKRPASAGEYARMLADAVDGSSAGTGQSPGVVA
jgi:hypothetical protein